MSKENLEKAKEKAEYHASMSRLEYVVIIDILSDSKELGRKLNFPLLYKEIQKKYGDEFTEDSIRYHVKTMGKNNIIKRTKNEISLLNEEKVDISTINDEEEIILDNNEYYEPKILPEKVMSVMIVTLVVSSFVALYGFYSVNEKMFDIALAFIICVSMLLSVFHIDSRFDVFESTVNLKQKIFVKFKDITKT